MTIMRIFNIVPLQTTYPLSMFHSDRTKYLPINRYIDSDNIHYKVEIVNQTTSSVSQQ